MKRPPGKGWTFRQLDLFGFEGPNLESRRHRRRRYGITQEEFLRRIREQRGACAICQRLSPGGRGTWPVDHVHGTNPPFVRGLLCRNCNLGIGLLEHDPVTVLKAFVYLIAKGNPDTVNAPVVSMAVEITVRSPDAAIDGVEVEWSWCLATRGRPGPGPL